MHIHQPYLSVTSVHNRSFLLLSLSLETAHPSRDNFLSYSCMHKQPLALELLLHVQQISLRQGKWG